MAGQQADVTLPAGSTINTDTGTVTAPNGAVAVATTTVAQSGGPTLRVLMAKSWIIENVRVSGSLPLAIVSSGDITVRGVLDLSADGATAGPGAFNCGGTGTGGAPGSGFWARVPAGNSGGYPAYLWQSNGAGGGGFGGEGGAGGERTNQFPVGAGGIINGTSNLVPLRGGCAGNALIASYAGAGGGALQLVTNKTVRLVDAGASKGIIHVGGGRGAAAPLGKADPMDAGDVTHPGSGGSGGGILIEAAALVLDANTALLAAGGGGGGYGACTPAPNGLDAPASASTPVGGGCPGGITPAAAGGDGGTAAAGGPGVGTTNGCAGSGGGGVGRIRVNTSDGQYTATGALVRGAATTGMAGKH